MSSALVELRKQLRAEELKLLDLHKASEVAQAARATKSTTAATKFTSSELAEFQRVFDEIDTDKSGTLTVTELGELASRLGVEMTQEQLKRQTEVLDTNNDGVLSFDEFVGWWAAEKSEGGPNMVQMFMLKTRMKAEMVRRSLQKSLAITPDASEAMARISATINVGHGGSSSSKSASSIGFTALPIDNETFQAAMKNKQGDTDVHDGAVEIKFSVRPGTTPEDVQNILPSFQANFGIAFEQLGMGSDFDVKASDDSKFILVKLLTPNVQPNGRPKKKSVLDAFLEGAGQSGAREVSLSDVMSAANLTVEFDRDISDSFSWAGMEEGGSGGGTICDILKGITASASVRCHRSTVTAIAPEPDFPNIFFKQGFVVGSLLGENAQNLEFVSKLSSPAEMKTVFLRLIEGFPFVGDTPTPEEEASAAEVRKCFHNAIAERYDCLLSLTVPEMLATMLLVDLYDTSKIPPPTPEELLQWVNWARPDGERENWIKPDSVPSTTAEKKEDTTTTPPPKEDSAGKSGSDEDDDDDDEESGISPQQALINSVVTMLGIVDGIQEVSILRKQVNLRITCNNLNVLQLFHLPQDDADRGVMLRRAFIGLHRKVGASVQTRDFSRVKVDEELRDSGVMQVLENILENFSPISLDMLAPPKKVAGFKLPPIDKSDLDWNRKKEEGDESAGGADGGGASSDEN